MTNNTARVISFAHMSPGETFDRRQLAVPTTLDRAWSEGDGLGSGVRVAIIDSGVAFDGPMTNIRRRVAVKSGTHKVVNDNLGDAASHGSACAHIIASMAPRVEITSVRVLGPSLGCTYPVLVAALEWSIGERFDIVNLSLSTAMPAAKQALHDVIDTAHFANIAIVAAAHNRPVDSFPWGFPSVFSVGSHERADREHFEVNPRPPVEFFAAGLRVPVPRGDRTVRLSGNSFATPHISGIIARIRAAHPRLTLGEIKHVLAATAGNLN